MEKKCENCVFCMPTPSNMALPNDFICGSFYSKWHGYWPINGSCDNFKEPLGKTVEEVFEENENAKNMFEEMLLVMDWIWGRKGVVDAFMKQDAAVLNDYRIGDNE